MSPSEAYLFLFVDSLITHLIVPVRSEIAAPVMIIFNHSSIISITFIALLGGGVAFGLNYILGHMLKYCAVPNANTSGTLLSRLQQTLLPFAPYIALFSALSYVGPVIVTLFGLIRIPWKYIIPTMAISLVLRYSFLLYSLH